MFHLRKRTADMPKKRKRKGQGKGAGPEEGYDPYSGQMNMNALPYLVELHLGEYLLLRCPFFRMVHRGQPVL